MAKKKTKQDDYQLVIGVCRDNGVIIDLTYNGILNDLNDKDLKDVYYRLTLLRKDVKSLLKCRWLNKLKERFKWIS